MAGFIPTCPTLKYPNSKFVGLPDKFTDDPVAHSAWESSTLDQGHPHVTQAHP